MSRLFGLLGCVIVLVAMFEGSAAQTTHIVLDDMGWVIPVQGGAGVYTAWAANKTFMVGDILSFNFTTGQHDVVQVTRASFDSCAPTSITGQIIINGPANVTLTSTGEHYYICTVGPHCSMGQKLAINVTGPPPPSSAPTEAPTVSTPPQSPGPSAAGPTTPTGSAPPPSLAPTGSAPPPSLAPTRSAPPPSLAPTAGSPPPSLAPTGGPTPSSTPPQPSGPTASTESPPPSSTPTDGPTTSTPPPQTTGPPAAEPPTTTSPPSPPNSASVAVTASRFVASGSVILVALSLVI